MTIGLDNQPAGSYLPSILYRAWADCRAGVPIDGWSAVRMGGLARRRDPPSRQSLSAPQHGQPQGWRHLAMRKGFVSETDLTPIGDLRFCGSA
jgi:hypothetical protein